MSAVKRKKSLAEQIAALSTPKPVSYHPDQEFLEDDTAAKLCDITYDQEEEGPLEPQGRGRARRRFGGDIEEDPKYAGRVVSRKELEWQDSSSQDEEEEGSESELDSVGDGDSMEDDEAEMLDEEDVVSDEAGSEGDGTSDQSGAEEEEEVKGVETLPLTSLRENLERGKAARKQIKLQDGLLETRIKLQGVLSLSNRLPAPSMMPVFLKEGGPKLHEALEQTCSNLHHLLDSLLELQETLTSRCKGSGEAHNEEKSAGEDEEIESDSEAESGREQERIAGGGVRKRKRKRPSSGGRRDYEAEISKQHEELRPYWHSVLSKWDEKTKLSSGKITSKSFMEVDRSIVSQIQHVLKDKERLRRRTQLKRSVYRILGEPEEDSEEGEEDKDSTELGRDSHLKDYNENIFDDDDFYHQLLRELIERKTSSSGGVADPVEMGRRWLELQKLRNKAKKKVDTKASKGRKLRYHVHPKLVDFMAPVEKGTFSDTARNSLFSSLFGAHHYKQSLN